MKFAAILSCLTCVTATRSSALAFTPGIGSPRRLDLPGPSALPILGSLDFLVKAQTGQATSDILLGYRDTYGDTFSVATGPIRQCWASGDAAANELLQASEVAGRPSIRESSFGDFLFLVRERDDALRIRKKQKAWIKTRVSSKTASAAVENHFVSVLNECFSGGNVDAWPGEAIERAALDAMLGLLLGTAEDALLTEEESDALFAATSAYRKRTQKVQTAAARRTRALKAQMGSLAPRSPPQTVVRTLIEKALSRSDRKGDEDALPIVVSAVVGGAEIFPLLLQWIVRRLAVEPKLQADLREEMRDTLTPTAAMVRACAAASKQVPMSAAVGPPRKVLRDIELSSGATLREGSLVFVMHPALPLRGSMPPLELDTKRGGFTHMYGAGDRSCLAAELSTWILGALVGAVVRDYEWRLADGKDAASLLEFKQDGSLNIPAKEVPFIFKKVARKEPAATPQEDQEVAM